ncbi:CDP-glucose 4,6-dehydratase [Porticoccaceae bacterium]|nr:CDP-glucose 4,6-dehydratase [Porticoccaceae bacterium]
MDKSEFWNGKKVFLTGHTGFKGSWLSIWLSYMGAVVKGYSLEPSTSQSLFVEAGIESLLESEINDIRNYSSLCSSLLSFSPDIIFHMAAQPLVRASYKTPLETYEINVIGTANLLEAVRQCRSVKVVVNITSDKCYENNEWVRGYKETDPMGGKDPYSSSKGCAELVTASYRESFLRSSNVGIATARAGNVIGGGDWAEDRLIPDFLRAFDEGEPVVVRNPNATRPWQYVLEPLSGYLLLAEKLFENPCEYSGGWNFGPYDEDVRSVEWILNRMTELLPGSSWILGQEDSPYEATLLKLDISKAGQILNWIPTWDLTDSLKKVIKWHACLAKGADMRDVCLNDIKEFTKDIRNANH